MRRQEAHRRLRLLRNAGENKHQVNAPATSVAESEENIRLQTFQISECDTHSDLSKISGTDSDSLA